MQDNLSEIVLVSVFISLYFYVSGGKKMFFPV